MINISLFEVTVDEDMREVCIGTVRSDETVYSLFTLSKSQDGIGIIQLFWFLTYDCCCGWYFGGFDC